MSSRHGSLPRQHWARRSELYRSWTRRVRILRTILPYCTSPAAAATDMQTAWSCDDRRYWVFAERHPTTDEPSRHRVDIICKGAAWCTCNCGRNWTLCERKLQIVPVRLTVSVAMSLGCNSALARPQGYYLPLQLFRLFLVETNKSHLKVDFSPNVTLNCVCPRLVCLRQRYQ